MLPRLILPRLEKGEGDSPFGDLDVWPRISPAVSVRSSAPCATTHGHPTRKFHAQ